MNSVQSKPRHHTETDVIAPRTNSILDRLTKHLALMYLFSVLLIAVVMYFVTKAQVYAEARSDLTTITNMMTSIRSFVREENTTYLINQGIWHPSAVSPVVSAKGVAARFRAKEPDKIIRVVSDSPLNAENLPNPLEKEIVETFRSNKNLKPSASVNLEGRLAGQNVLVYGTPEIVTKGCLACHGNINEAPPSISTRFPGPSGYNWQIGQVVGASIVGVPVSNVETLTVTRAGGVMLTLSAMFVGIWMMLRTLLERNVIMPIRSISQAITNLSLGRPANFPKNTNNDEIGELTQSGERIRRAIKYLKGN
jgi:HAMP domain-containing protein